MVGYVRSLTTMEPSLSPFLGSLQCTIAEQLMDTFASHRQFLREAHAYPLTNFPGHTQENLLGQLLRKKLDPKVDDWIGDYTSKQQDGGQQVNGAKQDHNLGNEELKELWKWARSTHNDILRPIMDDDGAFEDDYTIAEREAGVENVVTGLKRKLDGESEDDEDEEDDQEDDKMEDVMPTVANSAATKDEEELDRSKPPLPLENALRYMMTGVMPGNTRPNR